MFDEKTCISVTQLNTAIKRVLEGNEAFSSIFLRGEISNFKVYSSGHAYFSLKDDKSTISAVMWASAAAYLSFMPKEKRNTRAGATIQWKTTVLSRSALIIF